MQDFNIIMPQPVVIYCDNNFAIKIANNLVFHEHTKRIKLDYHTIQEKIQQELVKLLPIKTNH